MLPSSSVTWVACNGGDRPVELHRTGRQRLRQLARDHAHAARRHRGAAGGEHAKGELKEAAGGLQPLLQENTAVKGPEEAVDDALAKAEVAQVLDGRRFAAAENIGDVAAQYLAAQQGDAQLIGQAAYGSSHGRRQRERTAKGIADAVGAVLELDLGAGIEAAQVERFIVEYPLRLGIGVEQHLEAAVEQEALNLVRTHAPADAVGRFVDAHAAAVGQQVAGGGEAGETGADNQNIGRAHR